MIFWSLSALLSTDAQRRQPQATHSGQTVLITIWGQLAEMRATPGHYHTQSLFNKSGHGSATTLVGECKVVFFLQPKKKY